MAKPNAIGDPRLRELGERIAKRRKELGLTQLDLSIETGLAKSHICDYEKGRKNPSLLTLFRLAKALLLPVSSLLEGI